jgi:hypothetical protein
LLAFGHPFLDGNGCTLMVVRIDLARRTDMHIGWEQVQKAPYLAALTPELEGPGAGTFDAFLAPSVCDGARRPAQTIAMLAKNPRLGPTVSPAPGKSAEPGPLPTTLKSFALTDADSAFGLPHPGRRGPHKCVRTENCVCRAIQPVTILQPSLP